ncbi:MAG: hypothetical protein HY294_07180, partial [Candidatus Rokubacteria bacterium]|nr:hypothetical protein [Candidatus Rokubacteria bacterium]
MIRRDWWTLAALLGSLTLLTAAPAAAQGTFSSGSTGADGALSPGGNVTIPLPPSGVFNYTTISIPPGVTVTFTRNAANTPVTLLASGDVSIGGTITLDGQVGGDGSLSIQLQPNGGRGGPGGSDGGTGANGLLTLTSASGLGPGGGPGGPPGGPRAA